MQHLPHLNPSMPARPIYLDYHATTPVDPRVASVVMHHMTEEFGNASSTDHAYGDAAAEAVSAARREVADLVGTRERRVVFTSGATESVNLSLQGLARQHEAALTRVRIGLARTEHKAVLDTCEGLARQGLADLVWFPVDQLGRLDLEAFEQSCRAGLDLACVMAANNEIGTIIPLEEVARIAARHDVLLFCDATQAAGKLPIERDTWGVTFLALSAHKLYGPKGVGALVLPHDSMIPPLFFGGSQERGRRSGTANVPGIAGFGEACRLRRLEMEQDEAVIARRRDRLQSLLMSGIDDLVVNGDRSRRLAGNLHISVPDTPNSAVVARLRETVAISTGAACSAGAPGPSHVLRAIGLSDSLTDGALRIGLGKFTTDEEVERAGPLIVEAVGEVRAALR